MPLINVLLILVVFGALLYLLNTYVPMAAPIKTIINIVVVVFVCWWLLKLLGFIGPTVGR